MRINFGICFVLRLLGDEGEMMFWQVAQHYLRLEMIAKSDVVDPPSSCFYCQAFYLDGNYDILCDTATYKVSKWLDLMN